MSSFVKEGVGICEQRATLATSSHSEAAVSKRLVLNCGFIHQHDGDIVFYGVDAMTLPAFQALGIFAIVERLFAGRANQNFQQVFSDHDKGIVLKIGGLGISLEHIHERTPQPHGVRFCFRRSEPNACHNP